MMQVTIHDTSGAVRRDATTTRFFPSGSAIPVNTLSMCAILRLRVLEFGRREIRRASAQLAKLFARRFTTPSSSISIRFEAVQLPCFTVEPEQI